MRMTLTEVKRIEKIEKKYKRKFAYNKKKRKYGLTSFKRDFQKSNKDAERILKLLRTEV